MNLKGKNCFKVRQKETENKYDLTDLYWVNMWKGGCLEDTFNISLSVFFFSFFLKNKNKGEKIDSNQAKCCSSNMSNITTMPMEEPVRSAEHGQSAPAASASASRQGLHKTAFIKAQLYGQFHLFGIVLKDLHTFFFFFFFSLSQSGDKQF